jgi:hypothetical protein
VLTQNTWFAVGIHLGWNFTERTVYGAAASGTAPSYSLFRGSLSGDSGDPVSQSRTLTSTGRDAIPFATTSSRLGPVSI